MTKFYTLALLLFLGQQLSSQNFIEANPTPPFAKIASGGIAFSDIDGDGDQDVLLTGNDAFDAPKTKLYINDGAGNFMEKTNTPFEDVTIGDVSFSDVDNDGDQDVLITGSVNFSARVVSSKLYTNDGAGNFTEVIGTPFVEVLASSTAFSDIDGDNDQDLLITGGDGSFNPFSRLYINDGAGNFTEVPETPFENIFRGDVAFSDVDGDGDQDVLITGETASGGQSSKLYLNDGIGNFTENTETPFEDVVNSSTAFSDIDGDGDQDVLITGLADQEFLIVASADPEDFIATTRLYLNDGAGNFVERTETPFTGIGGGAAVFSDIDNDGDLDLFLNGITGLFSFENPTLFAGLYLNDGIGNFIEVPETPFEGTVASHLALADIDNDGDSDVLLTGYLNITTLDLIIKLYINGGTVSSTTYLGWNPNLDFTIYPNPATTTNLNIRLEVRTPQQITIRLLDTNGRMLSEQQQSVGLGEQFVPIEANALPSGSYWLQVEDDNGTVSRLLVLK